jgi:hypothetical protein
MQARSTKKAAFFTGPHPSVHVRVSVRHYWVSRNAVTRSAEVYLLLCGPMQSLRNSGGSSLKLLGLVSGFALLGVIAACAEAPVDEDPGGLTSNVNKAEPEHESQTLPASNPPAPKQETTDAGAAKDSGTSSSSGGSTSSSSGGSSSGSTSSSGGSSSGSTSSSSGSSSGGTGAVCDPNDPLYLIKAFDELNKPTPKTCGLMGGTCGAGECCFDAYGVCVAL